MVTETNQGSSSAVPTVEDMDNTSQQGWNAFTKFLAGNVALTVLALVVSDAEAAMALLRQQGETPFRLGQVTDRPGIEISGTDRLFA